MRWVAIFFVALLLLYVASPYFSVWRFTVALNSRNGACLAAHIDFPAVRESLKQQFRAALHRSQNNDQTKHKKVARLLTAFGPSLSDRLDDALVDTYHLHYCDWSGRSDYRSRSGQRCPNFCGQAGNLEERAFVESQECFFHWAERLRRGR